MNPVHQFRRSFDLNGSTRNALHVTSDRDTTLAGVGIELLEGVFRELDRALEHVGSVGELMPNGSWDVNSEPFKERERLERTARAERNQDPGRRAFVEIGARPYGL